MKNIKTLLIGSLIVSTIALMSISAGAQAPEQGESNGGKKIYAKSYLNQKAPELIVDQWLSEKPDTKGKFVLIDFWATWCGPCRRAIPELNKFQKTFADNLVVIGLSEESKEKVLAMTEPVITYASAIDSLARTQKEYEVVGIPHVVLIDPQGIVRWEGFPAQPGFELNETVLQTLIDKYSL